MYLFPRIEVHHEPLFRILRRSLLPVVDEPLLVAIEHVHVLENRRQVLVRADPVTLQLREPVDERLVVDRIHEVVVLVPDVRRVAVEHGVLAVVLLKDLGPVDVFDDHVVKPYF